MSSAQCELTFEREARESTVNQADVDSLVILIANSRDWLTAKKLGLITGHGDRKIRALAKAARGHILSGPGSPGYRHTRTATPEEVDHYTNAILKQADEMRQHAIDIRRVYYGHK